MQQSPANRWSEPAFNTMQNRDDQVSAVLRQSQNQSQTPPGPSEGASAPSRTYMEQLVKAQMEAVERKRADLARLTSPEGQKAYLDNLKANAPVYDGVPVYPDPVEAQNSLNTYIRNLQNDINSDERNLYTLMKADNPQTKAQAALQLMQGTQAYNATARDEAEKAANGGWTNRELYAARVQDAQTQLMNYDRDFKADTYRTDQGWKEWEAKRTNIVDQINAANRLMEAEDNRNKTRLEQDSANWRSLYEGANKEWQTTYNNQVSQRHTDISAATDMARIIGESAGKAMPFVAPRWQMEQIYGAGGLMAQMGAKPVDFSKMGPPTGPSYDSLLNASQNTWNTMMGGPGLPQQIQPPQFNSPGAPPSGIDYFGVSPNQEKMEQMRDAGLLTPPPPPPVQTPVPNVGTGPLPTTPFQPKTPEELLAEQLAGMGYQGAGFGF